VFRRKVCPFLEVQLPRFQRGGAAESTRSGQSAPKFAAMHTTIPLW
jgi:hypothetical protein